MNTCVNGLMLRLFDKVLLHFPITHYVYFIEDMFYNDFKEIKIGYDLYDGCEERNVLADILSEVILESYQYSSIILIMSLEMNRLAASILFPWNIDFFAFTLEPMYPQILIEHPNDVFYYDSYNIFLNEYISIMHSMNVIKIYLCNETAMC